MREKNVLLGWKAVGVAGKKKKIKGKKMKGRRKVTKDKKRKEASSWGKEKKNYKKVLGET